MEIIAKALDILMYGVIEQKRNISGIVINVN